jgi:peptidoglycan/xylan/chitin deacetylase (PgdA/CDA1 family)
MTNHPLGRLALVIGVALTGSAPSVSLADAGAKVVFTFDVSARRVYERTLPMFSRHDMRAVVYAETAQMNSGESWVMSWEQLRALQDVHGWEIAGHTITHPDLTGVSETQLERELKDARDDLVQHGLRIRSFATPYGAFNLKVLAAIAKYYESHRAAWGGPNLWPTSYDDYHVRCYELQNTVPLGEARRWVDEAVAKGQTLVLLNHELVDGPPAPYEYNVDDYDALLDYVATQPITVTTMSEALFYTERPDLVRNGSFSQLSGGWATGWTRSDAAGITIDGNARGNHPEPGNSAKLVGGATPRRLTSTAVPVAATKSYALRMYQNAQDRTAGGWAVWADEFTAGGQWIGGQWLGGDYLPRVGNRYYQYRPSAAAVASMQFTLYTEENSQLTLYVDSVELREVP